MERFVDKITTRIKESTQNNTLFKRDPRTARIGVEILNLEVGYLPIFFQKKAEAELKKTNESKLRSIQELKEMISTHGDNYMKSINFDEDFLVAHLRTRKYNLSKTFKALKAFIMLTLKNPDMFRNFSFEETVKSIKDETVTMLPYRCQDGCAIMFVQLGNWDVENFPLEEVKRMLVVMLMQTARDPMTQVNGFKVIIDVGSGMHNMWYLTQCLPHNLYLLYHATQDCIPGRFKGIHVVNFCLPFLAVWMIVKAFMSPKLRKRVIFHDTHEELFDYFPRAVVPAKYGGDLVDYDQTEWLRRIMAPEMLATMGGGVLNVLNPI